MNQKGFTLVELLGVIIILGIISMIAIGSITSTLGQAHDKAYEAGESGMRDSAANLLTDCNSGFGDVNLCTKYSIPKANQSIKITLADLISGNYMNEVEDPTNNVKYCDKNASYVIVKQNTQSNSYNFDLSYQACLSCSSYKTEGCSF